MEKKVNLNKKKMIAIIVIVVLITALCMLCLFVVQKNKKKQDFVNDESRDNSVNIENISDLDEQEQYYGDYLNQKRKQIIDGVVSKVGIV